MELLLLNQVAFNMIEVESGVKRGENGVVPKLEIAFLSGRLKVLKGYNSQLKEQVNNIIYVFN
jgi:hypothetical protein